MTTTTWELHYSRTIGGTPNDFSTTIEGPAPVEHVTAAGRIPADVRAFALYVGHANGADHVTYCTTDLADCTGYAEHRSVARVAHVTPQHAEPIERGQVAP